MCDSVSLQAKTPLTLTAGSPPDQTKDDHQASNTKRLRHRRADVELRSTPFTELLPGSGEPRIFRSFAVVLFGHAAQNRKGSSIAPA